MYPRVASKLKITVTNKCRVTRASAFVHAYKQQQDSNQDRPVFHSEMSVVHTSRAAAAPSNSSWQVFSSTRRKDMERLSPSGGGNSGSCCSMHTLTSAVLLNASSSDHTSVHPMKGTKAEIQANAVQTWLISAVIYNRYRSVYAVCC